MLKSICLVAAIIAVATVPAFGDNQCGPAPIGPAIPAASDLNGKTVEAGRAEVLDAYHQVKAYQGALQPYRACLKTQADAQKAALSAAQAEGEKGKDKIAAAQQAMADLDKVYLESVDAETQVASDFNNLHVAQCVNDTDTKICPKKQ
jgi:hypothetical protein